MRDIVEDRSGRVGVFCQVFYIPAEMYVGGAPVRDRDGPAEAYEQVDCGCTSGVGAQPVSYALPLDGCGGVLCHAGI